MTSTEESGTRIRLLLVDRMAAEPPAPPLTEVLGRCREGHRRHRRRLALGAAAAGILVVAPIAALALGRSEPRADTAVVDVSDMSDREVLARCLDGNQSPRATARFVASGEPQVRLRGTVAEMSTIVLVSADGHYWADCFINHYDGAEFSSGMLVYDGTVGAGGVGFSSGFTCKDLDGPPTPACPTFMVDYVDRLPEPIASVDFITADGQTTNVPTVDGFVLFTYEGQVPTGWSRTEDDPRRPWLVQVTYRDADGQALAASRVGTFVRDRKVGDLPLTDRYPSLRSQPLWEGL